jgi:Secretion system C-terminal sorting domain
VDECTNAIDEVGLTNVTLFPNPNEGLFTITGLAIGTEYEIFDETGRLIVEGITKSIEQEVQLKNVQTGVYYLYATQKGVRGSVKFLITK